MTPKNLLIVGLCLVMAGMLIALLFRPVPPPVLIGKLTTEQEDELRATIVTLEGQNDSLRRELDKSKAAGKTAQEAFNSEIKAKAKTIAELKARPAVIEIRKEEPEIDELVTAQDSLIGFQQDRIAQLTTELQTRDNINAQIQANFERRLSSVEQLLHDKTMEVEQSAKEIKKLRRRLFWTKVGGVALCTGIVAISL